MLAPRLRHRVDIEEPIEEQNTDTGAVSHTWASILGSQSELEPAEILALSGRELVAAQAIQAGTNTKITIRYRSGLTAKMRITHDGDVYNIRALLPDATRRRYLTVLAETGLNEG